MAVQNENYIEMNEVESEQNKNVQKINPSVVFANEKDNLISAKPGEPNDKTSTLKGHTLNFETPESFNKPPRKHKSLCNGKYQRFFIHT